MLTMSKHHPASLNRSAQPVTVHEINDFALNSQKRQYARLLIWMKSFVLNL